MTSFYDLECLDNKNQPFKFSELRGKFVLIVNTASKCGFTPQYQGLEKLYQQFKDQGFVVLGFPCNQFGSQEPGTNEEIIEFCSMNYNVSFPIMSKVDVNGDNAHPVYKYLKSQKSGIAGIKAVKWNFEKFLIDKNGNVVSRYSSITKPEDLQKEIEKSLKS
ncbi:2660_t:CDS:2 [Entrophospora sp. SA101]|nr:7967_t:CDS:2 [Entrophospora sp. SA101]CAJ0626375.1 2660_t:CDS:2 [Entrophospora sp. SA101]CAJ0839001.1 9492_t:CDS:2 [Entrophospora sp. SA101]CAJ0844898.1 3016_t:CDS:2 [Entrophospora sp. SA101]